MSEKNAKPRILFIDDDRNFRRVTAAALRESDFEVEAASNGQEGLSKLEADDPPSFGAILCDLKMPVMDGMAFLEALRGRRHPPVIVVTAFGSMDAAVEAMRAGAADFVTKPVNRGALKIAIERSMETCRLRRENKRLRERVAAEGKTVDKLVGDSNPMLELRETLERLAQSDAPVLLRGESGSGKELAARALHFDGGRGEAGRFVAINCAAVPGELLESELFGHRKGAFTGASRDHAGKFEAADGGTLFLDEIGDMPLALQAKLLRALQEGEITPVGEDRSRHVDVRVVAATNQALEEKVRDASFRQDLFYRLAVVPIRLPPLRERLEDIEALALCFLAKYGAPADTAIEPQALREMESRSWPGNVRELENAIMRARALRPDLRVLKLADLAPPPLGPSALTEDIFREGAPVYLPQKGIRFDEFERRLLLAAWEQSGQSQKLGAELLGLPRQAFIYRLQKHGVIAPYGDKKNNASKTSKGSAQ